MHILVTGGSRGIGKSIVETFSINNTITYFYKNNIGPTNANCTPIQCDCSSSEEINLAIDKAIEKNGKIDALIYNCGISLTGLTDTFSDNDYRNVIDTNFGGLFFTTRKLIPSMIENHQGNIIAISSMWGQVGASCESLYSASKGAVDSYIKSLAKELGPSGIRVNAVSPGVINTDMMNEYSDKDKQELIDETPLSRLGEPQDISNIVEFLLSDKSEFITGQILGVNGGFI